MSGLAVELSDLNGWAQQVERAGDDVGTIADYTTTHITDGDFGRILELITGDYNALIPAIQSSLATSGVRLGSAGGSLSATAADYRETDRQVAQSFGVGAAITDDGDASGFRDVARATPVPGPSSGGQELPEVSFGSILDSVCGLIVWVGGPDPREHVTQWIAGDIGKASMQASAWEHAATCLRAAERNLSAGNGAITTTWTGGAARTSRSYMTQWTDSLSEQHDGLREIATHLREMVQQAVDLAQVVVDIIKTVISLCSAALSSAYIPGWGQWKAIKTVKEAITLINNARKVITVFWNALNMIKSLFVALVGAFGITRSRTRRPCPREDTGPAVTETPPELEEIRAAWRDLQSSLASARAATARLRARPVHTPDERRQLHDDALGGRLGRPMEVLARRVEEGETSWGEVFDGTSPYADLLSDHLDRMVEENRAAIEQAVAEDADFDPWEPDPEV